MFIRKSLRVVLRKTSQVKLYIPHYENVRSILNTIGKFRMCCILSDTNGIQWPMKLEPNFSISDYQHQTFKLTLSGLLLYDSHILLYNSQTCLLKWKLNVQVPFHDHACTETYKLDILGIFYIKASFGYLRSIYALIHAGIECCSKIRGFTFVKNVNQKEQV